MTFVPSPQRFRRSEPIVCVRWRSQAFAARRLCDVPTIDESGVSGYEATSWNALLAPRATPRELVQRINAALVESLHAVKVRTIITSAGADAVGTLRTNSPHS